MNYDGTEWSFPELIAESSTLLGWPSMDVDAAGNVHISYGDGNEVWYVKRTYQGDLIYEEIESGLGENVIWTSIVHFQVPGLFDSKVRISFLTETGGLFYAFEALLFDRWSTTRIDTGVYPSVSRIDYRNCDDPNPVYLADFFFSYRKTTHEMLKLVKGDAADVGPPFLPDIFETFSGEEIHSFPQDSLVNHHSMAVSPNRICLSHAYASSAVDQLMIHCADGPGGPWTHEVVDPGPGAGWYSSIGLDSVDVDHTAYFVGSAEEGSRLDLRHYTPDLGITRLDQYESLPAIGTWGLDLANTGHGAVHVAYIWNDEIKYATNDQDYDGWGAHLDNCPTVANWNQKDLDHDGIGTACDEEEIVYSLDLEASYTSGTLTLRYTILALEPATWANYLILVSPTVQYIPLWTIPLPVFPTPSVIPFSFPFPSLGTVGIYSGIFSTEGQDVEFVWVETG